MQNQSNFDTQLKTALSGQFKQLSLIETPEQLRWLQPTSAIPLQCSTNWAANSFPDTSSHWPAVGKERPKPMFDWLLQNDFISCYFQVLNSKIVISSAFLSIRGWRWFRWSIFLELSSSVWFLFLKIKQLSLAWHRITRYFWFCAV